MAWEPINEYPGDQRYDIPSSGPLTFWGEVGTTIDGGWEWVIVALNDNQESWEFAGGIVATEEEAKRQVEQWRAPHALPYGLPLREPCVVCDEAERQLDSDD